MISSDVIQVENVMNNAIEWNKKKLWAKFGMWNGSDTVHFINNIAIAIHRAFHLFFTSMHLIKSKRRKEIKKKLLRPIENWNWNTNLI